MARIFPALILFVLAVLTLSGNGREVFRNLDVAGKGHRIRTQSLYYGDGPITDGVRAMAERNLQEGESIFFATDVSGGLRSMDRALLQVLLWVNASNKKSENTAVRFGAPERLHGESLVFVSGATVHPEYGEALCHAGYRKIDRSGRSELWRKEENPLRPDLPWGLDQASVTTSEPRELLRKQNADGFSELSVWTLWKHELSALVFLLSGFLFLQYKKGTASAVFALMLFLILPASILSSRCIPLCQGSFIALWVFCIAIGLLFFQKDKNQIHFTMKRNRIVLLFLILLYFLFLVWITLSHSFLTTNGLGVYGGKALLFYLQGGVPESFWTQNGYEPLQPGYPPGWTMLFLALYQFAGCCGEWLFQLPAAFFTAVCFGVCLFSLQEKEPGETHSFRGQIFRINAGLWICSFFLSAPTLFVSHLSYPEPLMALCALLGWREMEKRPFSGWFLLGSCGWLKTEGILPVFFLWSAMRMIQGSRRANVKHLITALSVPVAWFLFSRFQGAHVYDYAPLTQPDFNQAFSAFRKIFSLCFCFPWKYGFVYPVALFWGIWALWYLRKNQYPEDAKRVLSLLLAVVLYMAAICYLFSLSRSYHFNWHLQSMERLLWFPAVLLLSGQIHFLLHYNDRRNILYEK